MYSITKKNVHYIPRADPGEKFYNIGTKKQASYKSDKWHHFTLLKKSRLCYSRFEFVDGCVVVTKLQSNFSLISNCKFSSPTNIIYKVSGLDGYIPALNGCARVHVTTRSRRGGWKWEKKAVDQTWVF